MHQSAHFGMTDSGTLGGGVMFTTVRTTTYYPQGAPAMPMASPTPSVIYAAPSTPRGEAAPFIPSLIHTATPPPLLPSRVKKTNESGVSGVMRVVEPIGVVRSTTGPMVTSFTYYKEPRPVQESPAPSATPLKQYQQQQLHPTVVRTILAPESTPSTIQGNSPSAYSPSEPTPAEATIIRFPLSHPASSPIPLPQEDSSPSFPALGAHKEDSYTPPSTVARHRGQISVSATRQAQNVSPSPEHVLEFPSPPPVRRTSASRGRPAGASPNARSSQTVSPSNTQPHTPGPGPSPSRQGQRSSSQHPGGGAKADDKTRSQRSQPTPPQTQPHHQPPPPFMAGPPPPMGPPGGGTPPRGRGPPVGIPQVPLQLLNRQGPSTPRGTQPPSNPHPHSHHHPHGHPFPPSSPPHSARPSSVRINPSEMRTLIGERLPQKLDRSPDRSVQQRGYVPADQHSHTRSQQMTPRGVNPLPYHPHAHAHAGTEQQQQMTPRGQTRVKQQQHVQQPPQAPPAPVTPVSRNRSRLIVDANGRVSASFMISPSYVIDETSEIQMDGEVARGAFGAVSKARFRNETVAAKKFFVGEQGDMTSEALANVVRELNTFKVLNNKCPHIVQFKGACVNSTTELIIVMELLAGPNLFDLLWEGHPPVTAQTRLKWATQLSTAIAHMHTQKPPLIHRDLKTQNVVVATDGGIRLVDFGKTLETSISFPHEVVLQENGGSPRYMAPESFYEGRRIGVKSDIWPLAACLIEIFGGPVPFEDIIEGDDVVAQIMHLGAKPRVPQYFPAALQSLLHKCFSTSPEMRPSAAEIVQFLGGLTPEILEKHNMNRKLHEVVAQ